MPIFIKRLQIMFLNRAQMETDRRLARVHSRRDRNASYYYASLMFVFFVQIRYLGTFNTSIRAALVWPGVSGGRRCTRPLKKSRRTSHRPYLSWPMQGPSFERSLRRWASRFRSTSATCTPLASTSQGKICSHRSDFFFQISVVYAQISFETTPRRLWNYLEVSAVPLR